MLYKNYTIKKGGMFKKMTSGISSFKNKLSSQLNKVKKMGTPKNNTNQLNETPKKNEGMFKKMTSGISSLKNKLSSKMKNTLNKVKKMGSLKENASKENNSKNASKENNSKNALKNASKKENKKENSSKNALKNALEKENGSKNALKNDSKKEKNKENASENAAENVSENATKKENKPTPKKVKNPLNVLYESKKIKCFQKFRSNKLDDLIVNLQSLKKQIDDVIDKNTTNATSNKRPLSICDNNFIKVSALFGKCINLLENVQIRMDKIIIPDKVNTIGGDIEDDMCNNYTMIRNKVNSFISELDTIIRKETEFTDCVYLNKIFLKLKQTKEHLKTALEKLNA